MPVSRPMMMISERTTSISRSDTRDERLLEQEVRVGRMLVGDARADQLQVIAGHHSQSKARSELGDDGPVGARLGRGRRATLLVLHPPLQVGDTGLALVGMRHR